MLLVNVCISRKHTHKAMILYDTLLEQLETELDDLRSLRAQIEAEGAIAPAKYTIDSNTNSKGATYYRLREGRRMIKSLGRGGEDLQEWRDRIKRRNALQQMTSHAVAIRKLSEMLSQGIDYAPAE